MKPVRYIDYAHSHHLLAIILSTPSQCLENSVQSSTDSDQTVGCTSPEEVSLCATSEHTSLYIPPVHPRQRPEDGVVRQPQECPPPCSCSPQKEGDRVDIYVSNVSDF